MKCNSCEMEINPQWKHAIEANVCPFCGKAAMDEHLKNLLASLGETMEKLQTYPDQLNDWMLSNHAFIKTDSPSLIKYVPEDLLQVSQKDVGFQQRKADQDKKFVVKVKTETGEEDVLAEKVQSEEKTNDFFRRAEAVKPGIDGFKNTMEKTEHLKQIVKQIKRGGGTMVNEAGESELVDPSLLIEADENAVAEYEASLSGGFIGSALPNDNDDEIPSIVEAMARQAGGGNNNKGMADLLKLQQQQEKMRVAREAVESGDTRGRGGFSRG